MFDVEDPSSRDAKLKDEEAVMNLAWPRGIHHIGRWAKLYRAIARR